MTTEVPDDRLYSADHEWVAVTSTDAVPAQSTRVGITRLAADSLGELVYLDLPEVGSVVTAGQACGEVESTKSVSELIAPVSGTVTAINDAAAADPTTVGADPYGVGWLFAVEISDYGPLMTAADYSSANGLES